ncbi:MAG: SDR family oxidoreductase [Planctomycetota bacterium]
MAEASRPVALITGAATGVGRACALRFAESGFDILVNFLGPDLADAEETVSLVQQRSVHVEKLQCDVSDNAQAMKMAHDAKAKFGKLNVLVNCAGTTHFVDHADLDAMTEEKWDQILAVNTKGPFFVTRACFDMLRAACGSIVNVSSVAGVSGAGSSIAYCASKGALNTMTKSLARALAPEVRVNAVCPGPIDSAWLRQGMSEQQIADRVASFPIPKLAAPSDIADAVHYLACGTQLTTGQLLIVDGGRTM